MEKRGERQHKQKEGWGETYVNTLFDMVLSVDILVICAGSFEWGFGRESTETKSTKSGGCWGRMDGHGKEGEAQNDT